ncbi:cytochrome P450 3A31-like [Eriocheir sinensis]|uniref:cytochrome P450 3A31-like n=1 Tax=Eriocheir sinensis TaxID=95602 RepID=UPI0021C8A4F5|nr:cytochrome P450 3A31-like [Eriocheir sinensis]XP_050717041.1 cytochrome P450 3A31-like [Eriocheir sinensis]
MALELLLLLALALWLYFRVHYQYWTSKGVITPPITPLLGHFHKVFFVNREAWVFYSEIYNKYRSSSMCGIYEVLKPVLVVWDPEIIRHVFVKDFDHFTDRRPFDMNTGNKRDKIAMEMLSLKQGAEWKSLRAIMTPTFTSGKIKSMFPLVCDKADALVKYSMRQASENPHVDMKRNFGRYTMDTIASCAFGIECNSLVNENDEFPRKAEIFFSSSFTGLIKVALLISMPAVFKQLAKWFPLSVNPPETDFFINVIEKTVAARRAGEKRGDFLDLLLEARESSDNPDSKNLLNDLSLIAQSVLFIVAGYDTTASLLAFSSFLLAKNKDQQERLREEMRQMVEEHGDITYQGIMEAKLLDACLQESLRLYPPAFHLERCCTKRYTLPGTQLELRPGDLIQVPVWSLHRDPRYWPNPEAFIPDRFLPENKKDIHPYTHMPFGTGPRNCIAMRFGLMEAKVALAKLLLEAELEPAPGYEELAAQTTRGVMRPKAGVLLKLKPIKE